MHLPLTFSLSKWKQFLLTFCINQLCITLISWPILIWWGLPLALLSPIGNLIFSPFLTGFLFLSLLVTLTQLFYIPNGFLVQALDWVVNAWLFITSQAPADWIITVAQPPVFIGIIPPVAAFLIMQFRGFKRKTDQLIALTIITISFPLILQLLPVKDECELQLGNQKLALKYHNGSLNTVIPPRCYFPQNEEQWVDYTLRPELARQFGQQKLDHCSCKRLNSRTCTLLKTLCKKGCVRHLNIPDTPLYFVNEIKRYALPKGITVTCSSSPSWQAFSQVPHRNIPHHRNRYAQGANEASKHPFHAPQSHSKACC